MTDTKAVTKSGWHIIADGGHPIWSVIRIAVLTLVLSQTASNFDETELMVILSYALLGEGAGGIRKLFRGLGSGGN